MTDFYSRIKKVKGLLIDVHRISNNDLEQHVIRHYLDTLHINEKIVLAKYIFSVIEGDDVFIEKNIKKYYDEVTIEILSVKFLLLGNGVENTLYRISDWTIKKGIKDKLSKFKISAQNINKSFIGYYTSEIDTSVLKVRNMMIKNRKGIMIEKASKKIS